MSDENTIYRDLSGTTKFMWTTVAALVPVIGLLAIFDIPSRLGFLFYMEQFTGVFIAAVYSLCFIAVKSSKNEVGGNVPWHDWLMAAASVVCGAYIAYFYPEIAATLGWITTERVVLGTVFIILTLEALRRTIGTILVVVVAVFLSYGFLAPYMPGPLRGSRTGYEDFVNYLYLDGNNGLGLIQIAATIGLAFILFGQILLRFGGSDLINNLVMSVFGTYRGGPAKAAVAGSSLVGTVTGGAATNVMLTGVVTIPLMKSRGYKSEYAGAIESVASTGGQIMPPVMGIAAFLIAENLGLPYSEVVLAATIPALLYYAGVFLQVDLAAARMRITGLDRKSLPSIGSALLKAWPIFPIFGFLVFIIMSMGYQPSTAGAYASIVALVLLVYRAGTVRTALKSLVDSLVDTTRGLLTITVVLAAAGLIVGVVNITGLGFNLAMTLSSLGSHSLLLLLIASAIGCIILGMGMPTVAAYTLVAILIAPAIVEFGVDPLAAHLFILYFAVVSNFTPPVAIACFAAATIAKADPLRIGMTAARIGFVAYIVPFMFVFAPALIMRDSWSAIIISVITALAGLWLISASFESYGLRLLNKTMRVLYFLAGVLILVPYNPEYPMSLGLNALGGFVFLIAVLIGRTSAGEPSVNELQREHVG